MPPPRNKALLRDCLNKALFPQGVALGGIPLNSHEIIRNAESSSLDASMHCETNALDEL